MNVFSTALYKGYRLFGERGAVILAYHSVGYSDSPWTVTPEEFAHQMQWLAAERFNVVSLDAIAKYRREGAIPPSTIAITFDDGYRDNYTVALPILEQHRFPAALFLTTGDVGGERMLPSGESQEFLSEEELHALATSGAFTIGAHSVTHPKFTKIGVAEIECEAYDSRIYVERLLAIPCQHFAYPHGRYSALAQEAVKRAGFSYAYTTEHGVAKPRTDDCALPRSVISRMTSFAEFKVVARTGIVSRARIRRTLGL